MTGGNLSSGSSAGLASVNLSERGTQAEPRGLRLSTADPGHRLRDVWWKMSVLVIVPALALWVAIKAPSLFVAALFCFFLMPHPVRAIARAKSGRTLIIACSLRKRPQSSRVGKFAWSRSCVAEGCMVRDDCERADEVRQVGKPPAIY